MTNKHEAVVAFCLDALDALKVDPDIKPDAKLQFYWWTADEKYATEDGFDCECIALEHGELAVIIPSECLEIFQIAMPNSIFTRKFDEQGLLIS